MLDMNAAIDLAVGIIERHEGCVLTAYADPESPLGLQLRRHEADRVPGWADLNGDPWTIGFGSTHGVKPGDKITKAEALYRLRIDLQLAINELRGRIGDVLDTLTNHQAAALFDFVFNLGTGKHPKGHAEEWTIWKILRAKRYDQVPGQLVLFVNAGGHKSHGLVLRRNDDIAIWSTEEPGSVPEVLPSTTTRVIDTPATVTDPVPASKSVHVWTMGLGALAGLPVLVKNGAEQITQLVSPYADQAPLLHNVMEWCGMAAAGAAVAGLAWAYLGKRWLRN